MKKFYAFAAAAMMSAAALAQNGAPLYITGAGIPAEGEWNAEAPAQFEYVDGQYVFEQANLTQFKISTACGDWDTFNAGVYGCDYGDEAGVAVALEAGFTNNIATPWDGDYKIVVAGDLSTITLTTDTPKPEGDVIIPVYVRGDMNSWGAEDDWKFDGLTKDVYKFVMSEGQVINVGDSFKFADANWNKINVGGDGNPLLVDFPNVVFNGGNPANFTLEEEFTGIIWLGIGKAEDGENCEVYLTTDPEFVPEWYTGGEESVMNIAAENGAAQYFNLQGVRVANPENGLFIVVKNGKASKVVLK